MKKSLTIAILSITTSFFSFLSNAQQTMHGEILSEEGIVVAKYEYNNPTCFNSSDGKITIHLLDGAKSLIWSDASTLPFKNNLPAGEYNFKLQLSENVLHYSLSLESPEEIIGTIYQTSNLSSVNLNLEITGGIAPYTYSWNNGNTTQNLENITSSGIFEVTILDQYKCKASTSAYVNYGPKPISDNHTENLKMDIDYSNKILTLRISQIQEAVVQHETGIVIPPIVEAIEYGMITYRLDKKGLYIITIFENDKTYQKKIIL